MRNHYNRLPGILLATLLAGVQFGCGKAPERHVPPQSPPRPTMTQDAASDLHEAVFRYSSKPILQFQDGLGRPIPHLVIHA